MSSYYFLDRVDAVLDSKIRDIDGLDLSDAKRSVSGKEGARVASAVYPEAGWVFEVREADGANRAVVVKRPEQDWPEDYAKHAPKPEKAPAKKGAKK